MELVCIEEYPQLIASDNIPKVSLLLPAEDIKERLGALCRLSPQFAGPIHGGAIGNVEVACPGIWYGVDELSRALGPDLEQSNGPRRMTPG
jgi:hypothetical protein